MASRILGVLALVLLTVLPPAFVAQVRMTQHPPVRALPATKVALSGRTAGRVERPRAELRALEDKNNLDFVISIGTLVFTGSQALQGWASYQQSLRDSERARRESNEGRTQAAADRMMEPFAPQKKKAEVVPRGIMKTISERIQDWDEHATIIAGRFGAGKSVAVEEALRDMQGVFVHQVDGSDWKEELFKRLGLDGPDMLEEVLRRVGDKLKRPPILLLDIPRTTKQGMNTVSSFAKLLSSDSSLAHVIVCASSAATAMAFDAGGDQRQKNYWVEDLSDDEAKEFLALRGHREDWEQFVQACGYRALDLHLTCGDYEGPATLAAKKEEMKEKARDEVLLFLDECEMKTLDGVTRAGANILNALVQDRRAGGTGVGALTGGKGAKPRDVAKWIRDNSAHAVIWHMPDRKYRFASELHAEAAANILKQSQSSR